MFVPRTAGAAAVLGMTFLTAVPGQASASHTRTVRYGPWFQTTPVGFGLPGTPNRWITITPSRGDRSVSVSLHDDAHVTEPAFIGQDPDRNGIPNEPVRFCGTSPRLRLHGRAPVVVELAWQQNAAPSTCPFVASVGGTAVFAFRR